MNTPQMTQKSIKALFGYTLVTLIYLIILGGLAALGYFNDDSTIAIGAILVSAFVYVKLQDRWIRPLMTPGNLERELRKIVATSIHGDHMVRIEFMATTASHAIIKVGTFTLAYLSGRYGYAWILMIYVVVVVHVSTRFGLHCKKEMLLIERRQQWSSKNHQDDR